MGKKTAEFRHPTPAESAELDLLQHATRLFRSLDALSSREGEAILLRLLATPDPSGKVLADLLSIARRPGDFCAHLTRDAEAARTVIVRSLDIT